jgi:hypothetical protein
VLFHNGVKNSLGVCEYERAKLIEIVVEKHAFLGCFVKGDYDGNWLSQE